MSKIFKVGDKVRRVASSLPNEGIYTDSEYIVDAVEEGDIRVVGSRYAYDPNKFILVQGADSEESDAIDPSYYVFPGGHEVRHISAHLTSFGGQAVQYIARSTRLDGQNKGDTAENLRKAIKFLEWELERIAE